MSWNASAAPQTHKTTRFSVFGLPSEVPPHSDSEVQAEDHDEQVKQAASTTAPESDSCVMDYNIAGEMQRTDKDTDRDLCTISSNQDTAETVKSPTDIRSQADNAVLTDNNVEISPYPAAVDQHIPTNTKPEVEDTKFCVDSLLSETRLQNGPSSISDRIPTTTVVGGPTDETMERHNEDGASYDDVTSTPVYHSPHKAVEKILNAEEEKALVQKREEQQLEIKRTFHSKVTAKKSCKWGRKNRRGRTRNRNQVSAGKTEALPTKPDKADEFDKWIGKVLKAWHAGEATREEDQRPPEGCGVIDTIAFDPTADEIAFPPSLTALQRRHVHGWAMQLQLFHASSGDDAERHVIVSKTGEFHDKQLTRGHHLWYKEGVTAPAVERFAFQSGSERVTESLTSTLRSFSEGVEQRDGGFVTWLWEYASSALDGSDLEAELQKARAQLVTWPLVQETDWEYVDTPEKMSAMMWDLETSKEFGFDVEAHNARTYHGLTCLLQISTATKDYVVDPLAEGMWECISQLRTVFANPGILKIGHSIRSCDVPSLFRDFGIVMVNAIDTEEAVHALGDKQSGLVTVLEKAGVEEIINLNVLKEAMQVCDWRERPLNRQKLLYARCDSHYLVPLWQLVRSRLLAEDTEANRQEALEEMDIDAIQRHFAAQQVGSGAGDDGGQLHRQELPTESVHGASTLEPSVSEAGADGEDGAGMRNMAESPVREAKKSLASEQDSRESDELREHARRESSPHSDSGSISDTLRESESGANGGEQKRAAMADRFLEEQGGLDEDKREVELGGTSAARGLVRLNEPPDDLEMSPLDEDDEADHEDGDFDDDEDEALWEGWGLQSEEGNSVPETMRAALGKARSPGEGGDNTLPLSIADVPATEASSGVSPPANRALVPQSEKRISTIVSHENSEDAGKPSAVISSKAEPSQTSAGLGLHSPMQVHIVHRDGVRLLWKTLCRTQTAASVLWRPPQVATREGAHKERRFRAAVQRLSPPQWTEVNIHVYEEIYLWRDRTARRLDDGPMYVCPGGLLIDMALALPTTIDALRRISAPLSPVLGMGNNPEAVELVSVVRSAMGLSSQENEVGGDNEAAGASGTQGESVAPGGCDSTDKGNRSIDGVQTEKRGDAGRGFLVIFMAALAIGLLALLSSFHSA